MPFLLFEVWNPKSGAVVTNAMVVNSIPTGGAKYFIFSSSLSGNEAKRGVELRHSTRNASRIRWKVGNGNIVMENGVSYRTHNCSNLKSDTVALRADGVFTK